MNPSQHWQQLVSKSLLQRCGNLSEAWRLTSDAHPDAAILMSAFGRSRSTVQFFNARRGPEDRLGKDLSAKKFVEIVTHRPKCVRNHSAGPVEYLRAAAKALPGNGTGQFANANEDGSPTATPELLKLFWLAPNATQRTFIAGFKGNGATLSPQNPAKIFAGVADQVQQDTGADYDKVIADIKTMHPDLWNAVEALAKEPV